MTKQLIIALACLLLVAAVQFHPVRNYGRHAPPKFASQATTLTLTLDRQILKLDNEELTLLNVPDVFQYYNYSSGHCSLQAVFNYYQHPASPNPHREYHFLADGDFDQNNFTTPEKLVAAAIRTAGNDTNPSERDIYEFKIRENISLEQFENYINMEIPVIALIRQRLSGQTGSYVVAIGHDNTYYYFQDPWKMGSIGYLPKQQFNSLWKTFIRSSNRWATHLAVLVYLKEGESRNIFPLVRPMP